MCDEHRILTTELRSSGRELSTRYSLTHHALAPHIRERLYWCSVRSAEQSALNSVHRWRLRSCTDNLIGIESAKSLAESIAGIKTLEWVTVTEQLALPVGALKRNDLTTLDLGRQKMGSADAIILASLLRQNTSLEVLELACKRPLSPTLTPPPGPCSSVAGR